MWIADPDDTPWWGWLLMLLVGGVGMAMCVLSQVLR